ncbi:hypothetical protein DSCOOX_49500 [Desulfosarcina ovata subsp. ovata]|uniref:Fibronectin type-III domain-containing protein n=1 Tax=Desulfosarcina ovata subsp. ovata TaxID=2752305 RepID=A0A5K8AIQ4_9BACT|nr:hypothetical protein DSCOOX_49500 [Desulfosarcina ovata subsp. ovata]
MAVIDAFTVKANGSQTVDGTVTESDDVFVFTPTESFFPDGTYQVSVTAVDIAENSAIYIFSFTVDSQVPKIPTIKAEILSGTLIVDSDNNRSNKSSVTVTGTREDDTAIYINGALKVALGTGDWSVTLDLEQGENSLEIWSRDTAGNDSEVVQVTINVDSLAPTITSAFPTADSFLSAAPAVVSVSYTETGSGLNTEACTRSLQDADGNTIAGTWDFTTDGTVSFTPAAALVDGGYALSLQLEDNYTNRSSTLSRAFTVDTVAPDAPVIDTVTTPTHNATQIVSGTKESYAAIFLNDSQVVDNTAATTWQATVTLTSGENTLAFVASDRAGNSSEAVSVVIEYDDVAPDAVTTLTVNGQGSGTTAALNWTGYDEAAHGDIAGYRIYWQEGASFSDVAGMTVRQTVSVGTFTATATGLTKGATVWFTVVAVDKMGNLNTAVTPVSATLEDIQAPENVTGLTVDAQADSLTFSWTASTDSVGDLAGYRVYLDDATEYAALAADQLSHSLTGLAAAEAHTFRITAIDDAAEPNESSGASLSGVTWLPNPTGLSGEPFSGYVQLSWSAAEPSVYVKQYRVYTSDAQFSSIDAVSGAHNVGTATGTSAKVAGLTDGQTYWFAVTTLNTSDGENPTVTAISATPEADTEGPELTDLLAGTVAFADGFELTGPVTLSLYADDPSGVSRIEFSLDGNLLRTDYSPPYTCYFDPADMADGSHELTITAYDTLDNRTTLTIGFTVALAPPEAPAITSPADGTTTNETQVVVSGEAEADATVTLYNNALTTGVSGKVDGKGHFSMVLTLAEGENSLQASAANRSGEGPLSMAVAITVDTTLPGPPLAITAEARSGGVIRITWQKPTDGVISGYNLYRGNSAFSDVALAEKVNTGTLANDKYNDVPASDGTWYYRVTSLDAAGNESEPSGLASADADSIAPRATAIVYSPEGAYDADTGTMAPGTVDLELTVSESLQATPFLSITPSGGTPISVDLTQVDDTTYSGFFVISETTPGGSAWAVFSGRDTVGNRGTEIDAGGTILIDTDGPSVSRLAVTPQSPIRNDVEDPVTVTAVLGLSEAVKAGTLPEVGYLLSGEGRETIPVDSLTQLATADGDAQTFQAVFTLPADAGAADAESLSLTFSAVDDLDNAGSDIDADNRFQVYQGDLPPLDAPDGLTGTALPGGKVQLAWNPVDEAVAYQVYRQGPDETELTVLTRLDAGSLIEYEDATEADGDYTYAVTSIRSENSQEAESGQSDTVTVSADSVAPGAPTDFALELVANGIKATWNAPAYTEPITYRLYRASASEITSVDGIDPLAEGIDATLVVDPDPSDDDHCYTVTAVDAAGNQSPPATSSYLNFDLLPVSSLAVVQSESDSPVVSWTHSGSTVAGYYLYLGDSDDGVQLGDGLITDQSYTDIGWSEDQRRYTVVAVDGEGVSSLGRSITLPVIEASLADDAVVRRGLMNRLTYTVKNSSDSAVDSIRLQVELGGITHTSDSFSLSAGGQASVDVVVGGYADLTDPADVTTTIAITPEANESVRIVRNDQVSVADGMLVLQIANDSFTRGGTGTVWFTLENTGDEEIEIVAARNSGNSDSDEIAFTLLDEDENVITAKAFRQAVGDSVITLADKRSVARIGAGEIFTASATTIDVPATAPDDVTVRLVIDNIHYHLGRDTEVSMSGLSTTHTVNLEETAYTGQLGAITPETSSGDEDIVITGRAIERATGDPLDNVPLNLTITVDGFESTFTVYTDGEGSFSYAYTPTTAGIFTVRVVHPGLTDKPVHGQFVVSRLSLSMTTANAIIPYNYEQSISLKVTTGDGTEVTGLRLEYLAEDQAGGVLVDGIHLTLPNALETLSGGSTAALPFSLWADNTADTTLSIVLRVASDENPQWGILTVNAAFSEASPVLYFTPDHIETGMAREKTVTETVALSNKGLTAMTGVTLKLLSGDGSVAPDWIALNVDGNAGDLAVGDTREVSITFAPEEETAEGNHHFLLRVSSDNYPQTDINLYAAVTQSGIGNVLFKVSDIYTGTLDDNLEVVQGLAGVKVVLQNEAVTTQSYSATTDSIGEAEFTDLVAGRYQARISSDNHQAYTGRVWVKPGITTTEDVFLEYNLVTVEWSVTETTIEDKYEIVLTATYETDVPAAVVVVSPTSIALPDMQAGDVFNTEITLTNHGLIRADEVNFTLPASDANFTYETLSAIPESIDAKQQVVIPIRVTCVKPLVATEDGSGGGDDNCRAYTACGRIEYIFICSNGKANESETGFCATYSYGDCSASYGGSGSGSGGYSGTYNYSTGEGSTSGYTPEATSIEAGPGCFPDVESRRECWCEPCSQMVTCKDVMEPVGSSVNSVLRRYTREDTDLSVKVPGGVLDLSRVYQDYQWVMEPFGINGADGTMGIQQYYYSYEYEYQGKEYTFCIVTAVIRNGTVYKRPAGSYAVKVETNPDGSLNGSPSLVKYNNVFVDEDENTITENESGDGYSWTSSSGKTVKYDVNGRVIAIGNRSGTLALPIYDDDNNGRLAGITDRYDRQVIWCEYDENQRLVAVQDHADADDPDCRRVQYHYDENDRLARVTDVLGDDTRYTYTEISRTITGGNMQTVGVYHVYSASDNTLTSGSTCPPSDRLVEIKTHFSSALSSIEDPEGRMIRLAYDENGDLRVYADDTIEKTFSYDYDKTKKQYYVSIGYPSGMVKEVWYDASGLTRRVDINGRTVKQITKDGRQYSVADENDRTTRYTYDEWNNLVEIVYPDGSVVENEYLTDIKRISRKVDELGNITRFEYNDANLLERKIEASDTDDERITEYTYDDDGNLLTITRLADGNTALSQTVMTYDEWGNLTSVTDPENGVTRFTSHDIMGNVLEKIGARGKTWAYTYNVKGNLKTVTDPLGNVTEHFYDDVGNRIRTVDAEGRETTYTYDNHDNLVRAVDHEGHASKFAYNANDKLIQQTDAEGKVLLYEYDNEGRLTATIDGHGDEIDMTYDDATSTGCASCSGATGSLPSHTIYPTFETSYTYDRRNRKTVETVHKDASTEYATRFTYDEAGNLVSRTDKAGRTTYYAYDALNRLIKVTDPASGETAYTYDDRDNLIRLTDAENQTTRFEYDAANRLIREIRPLGGETRYDYDAAGNLIEKIDAKNQKAEYAYDDAGRLEEIRYYAASSDVEPTKTVTFSYDKVGNLTGYDDGTTLAVYAYDTLYRKTGERLDYGAFSLQNAYTYYDNGLKETYTGPDAVTYGYLYDANNQLAAVQIPNAGYVTVSGYHWTRPADMLLPGGGTIDLDYDELLRLEQITTTDPAANPVLKYAYTYDNMDNITAKATEHGDYEYGYDALYRLIDVVNPVRDDEAFTYDGVGNRLTSADTSTEWGYNENNELTGYDDVTFDYDLNGNMIEKNAGGVVTKFFYNLEDRLERVEDGSGNVIASYYYDPFGRRLWKDVGGTRTCFHYSDEGLEGEYDATGTVIKTYGWKPGSTWSTDPLFMKIGTEYYYYHNDHLGMPQKMTSVSGAVVWRATYSSFGQASIDTEVVENNLRFPGQYYDAETGLHYNYHRYYDPATGRYLTADPIGLEGGINIFAYTSNNPVNLIDPFGLNAIVLFQEQAAGGYGHIASAVSDPQSGGWHYFSKDGYGYMPTSYHYFNNKGELLAFALIAGKYDDYVELQTTTKDDFSMIKYGISQLNTPYSFMPFLNTELSSSRSHCSDLTLDILEAGNTSPYNKSEFKENLPWHNAPRDLWNALRRYYP